MTLAKTMTISATAVGVAYGSALAGEGSFGMNGNGSSGESMAQAPSYYDAYGIDENADGVIDAYLILEQSETLG
jgi:hypothetical protein